MSAGVRVRVRFFAALREALGRDNLELCVPSVLATSALKTAVVQAAAADPAVQERLAGLLGAPNVRLAVNQALAHGAELELQEGDELAFLPPVTGG